MQIIKRSIQVAWSLRVYFTENVFAPDNPVLRFILADPTPRKILVVLEDALAQAQPHLEHQINRYFAAGGGQLQLVRPPLFVAGGESAKNSPTIVTDIHSHLHKHHVDRHSYLIAIGGGALLDVAGLAAATAHRGMRLVRLPSTTASQAGSGVGVKNGMNAFGQKNFVGTYAPPFAVVNDFNLLASLPPRDKRAGYIEAIKIACLRDAPFFDAIEADAAKLVAFEPAAMRRLIHRCAELHLDHLAYANDPFENGAAHPLDFGHWAAYKLELLTHSRVGHGDAVAIGIALDVVYSRRVGLLDAASAERILALIERLGFPVFADELMNTKGHNRLAILNGLDEFREQFGCELTIPLLCAIGTSVELASMERDQVAAAIVELRERARR